MPYAVLIAEGEEFAIYETTFDDYRTRFLPPIRHPDSLHGKRPENLTLNGRPAFEGNVMRIDFQAVNFRRATGEPLDPPESVVREAITDFHRRLRYTTKAAHAQPIAFPHNHWRLEYTNDDGSPLEPSDGHVRARGSVQYGWSFVALSRDVWNNAFTLPAEFDIPVWEELRLDALDALPGVGASVVLAATSLEVFIGGTLEALATSRGVSSTLWSWIRDRAGSISRQPTVEEQFDVLLREFCGHSLKEEQQLWEAFKNLKSARNAFVHEGTAKVMGQSLTPSEAEELVANAGEIIKKVREWLPEALRWPVHEATSQISFTQMLFEPQKPKIDA